MFKKIEIWIVYLILLLGLIFTIFFGSSIRYEEKFRRHNLGWMSDVAIFFVENTYNVSLMFKNPNNVENRFPRLNGFSGTPNSIESYLLQSRYDGNLGEGVVELIDLKNFKVLHTWNPDIDEFNEQVERVDEFEFIKRDFNNGRQVLFHPKLSKDRGLLFNTSTVKKINSCSELVFQNTHDHFHHSIETDSDDNVWIPSHLFPQTLPRDKVGRVAAGNGKFFEDAIVKLSPDGELIFEKSVAQLFIENGLEYLLFSVGGGGFNEDPLHINDIQPVNFDTEFWKRGDVFLSLRNQSMVLLYRPSTNKIIWKFTGPIFHQHDVDILDDHRIAIFNNNSKDYVIGDVVDGHNEVIIYDFKTRKYSSYLKDSLSDNDVRTITAGRSEILSNGDLFLEETDYARTLYFNQDGSLRWSHVNRAKNNKVYRVGWSRILYKEEDLQIVNDFIEMNKSCNE